jgi:hypothetical protein
MAFLVFGDLAGMHPHAKCHAFSHQPLLGPCIS